MLHRPPKYLIRCFTSHWTHRKVVVISAVIDLELCGEVFKGIKEMGCIKPFGIFPVVAFHFPVMPWHKRTDEFMLYAMCCQILLKECRLLMLRGKTVCKLASIVCLDTFNRTRESFHEMVYK